MRYERQADLVPGGPSRLLDIGTATGEFVDVMLGRGWDAWGIEASDQAELVAADRVVRASFPDEAPFPDEHFDVITAWAVFEHLHDPRRAFDECRRLLKPGGSLVVQVPNVKGAFGYGFLFEDVPRHLYLFSEGTLRDYAARSGLELGQVEHTPSLYSGSGRGLLQYGLLRGLGRSRDQFFEIHSTPRSKRFRRWPMTAVAWTAVGALERVVMSDRVIRRMRMSRTIVAFFGRPLVRDSAASGLKATGLAGAGRESMTSYPDSTPAHATPGKRIAEARRAAGLTQRALAERIGVRLGEVSRMEQDLAPSSVHASAIAEATAVSEDWLKPSLRSPTAPPVVQRRVRIDAVRRTLQRRWPGRRSRQVILGTLILLVAVRFFTEQVGLLPGFTNFIDIPLIAILGVIALVTSPDGSRADRWPAYLAGVFFAFCALGTVVNMARIAPAPVVLFIYMFLAPVALYYMTYRVWKPDAGRSVSQTLVGLGVLQFAVILVFDLPDFVATENPDEIAGTFGGNAYQLVYFLLVFSALVAGAGVFTRGRLTARLAPFLFGAAFLTIFLAQYRSLLATTILTVLFVGGILVYATGRGLAMIVALAISLVAGLWYVAVNYPVNKFTPTLSAARDDPTFFLERRLAIAGDLPEIYAENPLYILVGTGPGTHSSRSWQTLSRASSQKALTSGEEAQFRIVRALTGGQGYESDIAERYTVPRLQGREALLGSTALDVPYSSYLALLVETGLFGFFAIAALYVVALTRVLRMTVTTMRERLRDDALPGVLLATAVGFFVLMQMAIFGTWLEVVRLTAVTWILLAIATKEYKARALTAQRPGESSPHRRPLARQS